MNHGKSIRIFLADGTPGGIITAEIINWTGHVVTAPRSRLADLLVRPELKRTGVYMLFGDDPDNIEQSLAYIGETDDVSRRLLDHARSEGSEGAGGKDFWDRVVVITSKDPNLTKSHIRFIESRLVKIARKVGRVSLKNGNSPEPCSLPEADISDMAFFLEQIRIILPVLGYDLFREPRISSIVNVTDITPSISSPCFEMKSLRHGLHAKAQEVDGEFIVFAGSIARKEWSGAAHGYKTLRQTLITQNRLVAQPGTDHLIFTEDTIFKSPSAASAVVVGRPDNGRTSWIITETGQNYADWQEAKVSDVVISGTSGTGDGECAD